LRAGALVAALAGLVGFLATGSGLVLVGGLVLACLLLLTGRRAGREPVPPPTSSAPVARWQQFARHDPEQELRRLEADFERGRVSDAEYERRRAEILGRC
jgi:hypothetical protein